MMAVRIWSRDMLEPEDVKGNLVDLTNNLNVAHAKGMQFTIIEAVDGEGVMFETRNITKAREVEESDAFLSG